MPRREEALAAMRDALQLQDPEWDITPGTAEYKILEAVAQQIENITFNSVLNDYHFDVDKKTGLELDLFMSLFGFARIKAKRATGSITFSRATDAAQDYVIPLGTQVLMPATDFAPSLYFQTTISAVLPFGGTEVSVPGQAVVAGTIGNVSSAVITGIASAVGGITGINNPQAFSGGRDAETDDDLKARWRRTVFRNISGTEDQFLAVAFNEAAYVTRANLVGPIERYLEQIQLTAPYDLTTASPWTAGIASGTTTTTLGLTPTQGDRFPVAVLADPDTWYYAGIFSAGSFVEIVKVTNRAAGSDSLTVVRAGTPVSGDGKTLRVVFPSSVPDSKYTFPPGGEVVGLDTAVTSQQLGVSSPDAGTTGDYFLITLAGVSSTANIPTGSSLPFIYITTTGATNFGFDSVIQLEHEYTPISSRNNLSGAGNKTADKVDIFVDGEDPVTVTEQFPFPDPTTIDFGGAYTSSDFLRDDEVNTPQDGNLYTPLSKAPITTLPSSISVAATNTQAASTYYKDEDYWLVSDNDDPAGLEGSPRASNGIEWKEPLSITDDAAYGAGVFTASIPVASGKLRGWYAYVVTYEVDGIETVSITDTPEAPSAINDATHGRNSLVIPLYVPGPAHSTIWRKIYRSVGSASQVAAEAGPFYLLAVIKNNVTAAYEDNTADDALADIQPPKAAPEAGTLVSIDYNYNRLIERLDAQMDQVRLVGMDVLAHAADDVQLKFNLAVVMFPGAGTPSDVESDLNTILTAWINRKSFRNNIQIADLIEQAGQASGVDNVRLVRAGEERNEVQLVTATTTRATPDPALDTFKITIDGDVTGAIAYNESMASAREILEALPNIHEGNTFATQLNGAVGSTSSTSIQVDDNAGLHLDSDVSNVNSVVGGTAGWGSPGLYIQVDDEIMLLTVAADAGGTQTWTVKRAQLRTTGATHLDNADVHILGDVAVSYAASGVDHAFTIYFLPNYYTEVNDWGSRKLDLVTVAKTADTSKLTLTVARRAQGVGSGIQQIAANDQTIMATYYDDFYLDSDELPSIAGVDVLNRAQNTF